MLPGPTELALVLVIVLILFGAGKLPQVFEAFGTGIKKFRDAQREEEQDVTPPGKQIPRSERADEAHEVPAKKVAPAE
jgi:sec-independent protein translocase protein TatA